LPLPQMATDAHRRQLDKGGLPYIEHPRRVADAVRAAGYDALAVAAAWLHDVVEDTQYSLGALLTAGIPDSVVTTVDALTRRPGEPADDYYARVRADPRAHAVKWFDVADNSAPTRLAALSSPTNDRLTAKYRHARAIIGEPPPPD
jgi:hypothetical protein